MDRDERIRRYVDGELDARERASLLSDAEADHALATAILRSQALRSALVVLARSESELAPDGQVRRIMERASARRRRDEAGVLGALRALWKPRFRVSAGGALIVIATSVAIVALALGSEQRRIVEMASPAQTQPRSSQPVAEIAETPLAVPVRFMLPARGAASVSLVGDFNEWRTGTTLLDDADGDGVFVTTLLLPRGSYGYMFVIDGERWTTDPHATNYRDDGFGQRNAVVRVN